MVTVALALLLALHPIHVTVLQLHWDERSGALQGTLRVFEDDMTAASSAAGQDAASYAHARIKLVLGGRSIPLTGCGVQRVADAVVLCVRAMVPTLDSLVVRNTVLMERYADQVNVVRIEGRQPRTLLLSPAAPEQMIGADGGAPESRTRRAISASRDQ